MTTYVDLQTEDMKCNAFWSFVFTNPADPMMGANPKGSDYLNKGPDKVQIREFASPTQVTPLYVAACQERGYFGSYTLSGVRSTLDSGADVDALMRFKECTSIISRLAHTIYIDESQESIKYATEVLQEIFRYFPNPHLGDRYHGFLRRTYEQHHPVRVEDFPMPFFRVASNWLINNPAGPINVPAGFKGVLLKHLHFRSNNHYASAKFKIECGKTSHFLSCKKYRFGNVDHQGLLFPCDFGDVLTIQHVGSGPALKADLAINSLVFDSLPQTITTKTTVLLKRGSKLLSMDSNGKSDPYVILKGNNAQGDAGKADNHKSRCIKKTLDPEWNETFSFTNSETISVIVMDKDLTFDDKIGTGLLDLHTMPYGVPTDVDLKIQTKKGKEAGTIHFTVTRQFPEFEHVKIRLSGRYVSDEVEFTKMTAFPIKFVPKSPVLFNFAGEEVPELSLVLETTTGTTLASFGGIDLASFGSEKSTKDTPTYHGAQANLTGTCSFDDATAKFNGNFTVNVSDVAVSYPYLSKRYQCRLDGESGAGSKGPLYVEPNFIWVGSRDNIAQIVPKVDSTLVQCMHEAAFDAVFKGHVPDAAHRFLDCLGTPYEKVNDHVKHLGYYFKSTLLFAACESPGPVEIVQRIIDMGAKHDILMQDEPTKEIAKYESYSQRTAVFACSENLPALKLLVKLGAKPDAVDSDGINLFLLAAQRYQDKGFEVIKYLVEEHKIDAAQNHPDGRTPIVIAIMRDSPKLAKYLIGLGQSPDQSSPDKGHLFKVCVENTYLELVQMMIENKVPFQKEYLEIAEKKVPEREKMLLDEKARTSIHNHWVSRYEQMTKDSKAIVDLLKAL